MTLDARPGLSYFLAAEWASIPYFSDSEAGKLYSKIPQIQFPSDANGDTILGRDFNAYSAAALNDAFHAAVVNHTALPNKVSPAGVDTRTLQDSQFTGKEYQGTAALPSISTLDHLRVLANGTAVGWVWSKAHTVIRWPTYFVRRGTSLVTVARSAVPKALQAASLEPTTSDDTFTYQTPPGYETPAPSSCPRSPT